MSDTKARIIDITPQALQANKTAADNEGAAGAQPVLIPFRKKQRWGYCSADKKVMVPYVYESTSPFSEGLGAVQQHEKFGYINTAGTMVIPCKYEFAGLFKGGLAVVCIKKKYGFIDATGKLVIAADYDYADNFLDGLAVVERKGKLGFIDTTGKVVVPIKYNEVSPFRDGVSFVELGGKDLFIDKTGNEVPEPDDVIYTDGVAVDFSDEKEAFGVISKDKSIVVPYIYEYINDYSEGLAAASLNDKWGFLDSKGQVAIPFVFDDVLDVFEDGLALVEVDEDFGYIDKNGTQYWEN